MDIFLREKVSFIEKQIKEILRRISHISSVQSENGNISTLTVPTTDPGDGISIWLDGTTLKLSIQG